MNLIDLHVFPMFNLESHCTITFKVERIMSFPVREQKEGAMQNTFGLEYTVSLQYASPTKGVRKKDRKREKERKSQTRRLERKLTTPPSFFSDVNFIAISRLFTDKFVPTPDSECRLSGLLERSPKTEIRQDTRRWRQSKHSRCATTLLSFSHIHPFPLFSLFIVSSPSSPFYVFTSSSQIS